MLTRIRLAEWLYVLSGVLHFLLYPLTFAVIVLGFWKLGFWWGLLGMVGTAFLFAGLRAALLAVFALIVTWLDPDFFS